MKSKKSKFNKKYNKKTIKFNKKYNKKTIKFNKKYNKKTTKFNKKYNKKIIKYKRFKGGGKYVDTQDSVRKGLMEAMAARVAEHRDTMARLADNESNMVESLARLDAGHLADQQAGVAAAVIVETIARTRNEEYNAVQKLSLDPENLEFAMNKINDAYGEISDLALNLNNPTVILPTLEAVMKIGILARDMLRRVILENNARMIMIATEVVVADVRKTNTEKLQKWATEESDKLERELVTVESELKMLDAAVEAAVVWKAMAMDREDGRVAAENAKLIVNTKMAGEAPGALITAAAAGQAAAEKMVRVAMAKRKHGVTTEKDTLLAEVERATMWVMEAISRAKEAGPIARDRVVRVKNEEKILKEKYLQGSEYAITVMESLPLYKLTLIVDEVSNLTNACLIAAGHIRHMLDIINSIIYNM